MFSTGLSLLLLVLAIGSSCSRSSSHYIGFFAAASLVHCDVGFYPWSSSALVCLSPAAVGASLHFTRVFRVFDYLLCNTHTHAHSVSCVLIWCAVAWYVFLHWLPTIC